MNVIFPMPVTDTEFQDSNVLEADYAAWNIATAYTAGQFVIVTTGDHSIYEAITSTTGDDPATSPNEWLRIGATNRWRAFDGVVGAQTTRAASIYYEIVPSATVDTVAMFGLNGGSVKVVVYDLDTVKIYDQTISLVDTTDVADWDAFFFGGVDYDTEILVTGVPAYAGYELRLTVQIDSGTAAVGEIVMGKSVNLGVSVDGTSVGAQDFSVIERDAFGNASIVERAFIDEAEYQFALPTRDVRRVKRVLSELRATPAVYYTSADSLDMGALVYGLRGPMDFPLSASGRTIATLSVEGMT